MKFNELISERTRQLMKTKNWTAYQLSQHSAIPNSTLSHVLNCKSKTYSLDIVLNICRGFDIDICDFFNEQFKLEYISDDD